MSNDEKPDFEDEEAIEELYKYSQYVYEEELSKYSRIDDKATKYLSVLIAVIGVFSLLGKQLFGDIIPPENIIQIFSLIFATLLFSGLVYSSYLLFGVLNLQTIQKIKLDDDMIIFFKSYSKFQILEAISVDYKKATINNEKCTTKKVKILTKAYNSIAITSVFLFLFIAISIVNEWNNSDVNHPTRSEKMTIEDSNVNLEASKLKDDNKDQKQTGKNSEPVVTSPGLKLSVENYDSGLNDNATKALNEKKD